MLFNNAASQYPPVEVVTEQGYDMQFGTNVIGEQQLTLTL